MNEAWHADERRGPSPKVDYLRTLFPKVDDSQVRVQLHAITGKLKSARGQSPPPPLQKPSLNDRIAKAAEPKVIVEPTEHEMKKYD